MTMAQYKEAISAYRKLSKEERTIAISRELGNLGFFYSQSGDLIRLSTIIIGHLLYAASYLEVLLVEI